MLGNIGFPTMILIIVVALLLFGPNKLPELGRAFGKTLREFKKGASDLMEDEKREDVSSTQGVSRVETGARENQEDNRRLPD